MSTTPLADLLRTVREALDQLKEHTPLPWRREIADPLYGYYTLKAGARRFAEVWGDEQLAFFIISAPEWLAALVQALEAFRGQYLVSPEELAELRQSLADYSTVLDSWAEARKELSVLRGQALEADKPNLRKSVETVVDTFTRDEAQGYRSRDRQYAITVLRQALEAKPEPSNRGLSNLSRIKADPTLRLPGWDSYSAEPLHDRAVEAADTFLRYDWDVVPTTMGGIQLERHHSGCDIEVEFNPDGSLASVNAEPAANARLADLARQLTEAQQENAETARDVVAWKLEVEAALTVAQAERDEWRRYFAAGNWQSPQEAAKAQEDVYQHCESELQQLREERDHIKTAADFQRTRADARVFYYERLAEQLDVKDDELEQLREANRTLSHQLERRANGADDLTKQLIDERDRLREAHERLRVALEKIANQFEGYYNVSSCIRAALTPASPVRPAVCAQFTPMQHPNPLMLSDYCVTCTHRRDEHQAASPAKEGTTT